VHLLLTPLQDELVWPYGLPAILKLIKGVSARSVNELSNCSGPVWQEESFDHVLRSTESFAEKAGIYTAKSGETRFSAEAEDYPCSGLILARRTLLSAASDFDFGLGPDPNSRSRSHPKPTSTSKATDKSVRPTLSYCTVKTTLAV